MTNEEIVKFLSIIKENSESVPTIQGHHYTIIRDIRKDNIIWVIDEAIKALKECISSQAVIEHICENKECYKEDCKGKILKRCPDLQWVFDLKEGEQI